MKFNNKTLRDAVAEWLKDESKAQKKYGHISDWDTSQVTNMGSLFYDALSFNEPIGNWDVSNVKIMGSMFYGAISFNQPLNEWKMSKNVYLNKMFYRAISFNQPLDKWDVSNVTDMDSMFYNARSFNQSLEKWDVSNVTEMDDIFQGASSFNQPLSLKNFKLISKEKDKKNSDDVKKRNSKLQISSKNDGMMISNFSNAIKESKIHYSNGTFVYDNCNAVFRDKNGVLKFKGHYENGEVKIDECYDNDGNSIPIKSLYKKFCEKINSYEYDDEFKGTSPLDSDFTDRLGSILSYSDINKETLSKLKNDKKLRICCLTQCNVLAYTIGEPEDNNLLTLNDIRNYISNENGELLNIECWNGPNLDYIVFGRKVEIEDVKNLRLENVNIKLYQEVTELFIEITNSFLKNENEDWYSELLDNGDWKSVFELKQYFLPDELIEFFDSRYAIDYGGLEYQKNIGHIINVSFSDENSPIEVAITSRELMNDDHWFDDNYFQFYRLP